MDSNQTSETPTIDRAQDAARSMFDVLTAEGLSTVEKVAVRKYLDQLVRQEIDESISALQQLRSSF